MCKLLLSLNLIFKITDYYCYFGSHKLYFYKKENFAKIDELQLNKNTWSSLNKNVKRRFNRIQI